ncbi:MAG TPA: hypothetical protein PKA19_05245 [Bacillota bacterium]|nr:hypothetical protein [Bacillota bacterium]
MMGLRAESGTHAGMRRAGKKLTPAGMQRAGKKLTPAGNAGKS